MKVVIPVGGYGTRVSALLPPGEPKAMMRFAGKPFLEYQIELLAGQGVTEIILSVLHLSEKIKDYFGDGHKWGVKISYVDDGDFPLGTGGCLKKVAQTITDPYLAVLDGDTYLTLDIRLVEKSFLGKKVLGLMVVTDEYASYYSGNLNVEGDYVSGYREKYAADMDKQAYIDCGFRIFDTQVLKTFQAQIFHQKEILQDLIDKQSLAAYKSGKCFYEIGCPEGVQDFNNFIDNKNGKTRRG